MPLTSLHKCRSVYEIQYLYFNVEISYKRACNTLQMLRSALNSQTRGLATYCGFLFQRWDNTTHVASTYVYIYIYIHIHTYNVYICMHIMCIHIMYVCTYIYIYIYIVCVCVCWGGAGSRAAGSASQPHGVECSMLYDTHGYTCYM